MNIRQQNELLYKDRAPAGQPEHCICEDCVFYAKAIMQQTALVSFLLKQGLDPLKADVIYCYMEQDNHKYYSIDFFKLHAVKEQSLSIGYARIHIQKTIEQPFYSCSIDIRLASLSR